MQKTNTQFAYQRLEELLNIRGEIWAMLENNEISEKLYVRIRSTASKEIIETQKLLEKREARI